METLVKNLLTQFESKAEYCAISYQGERVSYSQLYKRVLGLCSTIRRSGMTERSCVVLCTSDPAYHCAGMLAALFVGLPYVPVDANIPQARLASILTTIGEDTFICCDRSTESKFSSEAGRKMLAENERGPDNETPCLRAAIGEAQPSPYQYILFTSGSTGVPKGAMVYRASFSVLVDWYQMLLKPNEGARCLVVSSLSFDLTQKNLFLSLVTGGTLYFLEGLVFEPRSIAQQIHNENITWINCAPTAFYLIAEAADVGQLNSLKTVVLGGEPINPTKLKAVRDLGAGCQFVNSYGPTECTDVVLYHELTDSDLLLDSIPLTQTVPGVSVILNDNSPDGKGELVLKGQCVGAGYLGLDDLTQQVFRFDDSGEASYHTGDIFKLGVEGDYHFVSRKDDQIKLRGYRIELGEIEASLNSHSDVSLSVAKVHDESIVVFVLLEECSMLHSMDTKERNHLLREHISTHLPEYFLPSSLVYLTSFPLNKNGKIDRQALAFSPPSELCQTGEVRSFSHASLSFFYTLFGMMGIECPDHAASLSLNEFGMSSIQKLTLLAVLNQIVDVPMTMADLFGSHSLSELSSRFEASLSNASTIHCIQRGL
ncbi:non-ribosomal peptide synthetase [Vibrio coralliilyticus]|nr:non-ribosomal peptide synthetase [Vibrio coralliilyticus]